MLNLHKVGFMLYQTRILEKQLIEYIKNFPVIGLTGPRQSGKSTLLQHALPGYEYVTFDDHKALEFLEIDPDGFMQRYANKVIFDEVQKAPEIFNAIKFAVDQDRDHYGKFVLTSSCQFAMLRQVSESLAGRIGLLTLLPFQYAEMPALQQKQAIFRGSYPELVNRDYHASALWYSSYIETYLNKDLRALIQVGDIRDFRRFLQMLAANTTQLINLSHYARDLGVSVPTIKRWLSALEASYIIFLLPPYYNNYNKRITKSPKVYFYDNGLVAYLMGIETKEHYLQGPMAGTLFENYIISEIMKRELHHQTFAELYFYRSVSGMEIDLIIDRKRYKEVLEIKHTTTFKSAYMQPMQAIMEDGDHGYLIYRGEDFHYKDKMNALNYEQYLLNYQPYGN